MLITHPRQSDAEKIRDGDIPATLGDTGRCDKHLGEQDLAS
jgi:hypothetical protein